MLLLVSYFSVKFFTDSKDKNLPQICEEKISLNLNEEYF